MMISQIQGVIKTLQTIVNEHDAVVTPTLPRKTVALVIGHSARSQGAVNRRAGLSEYQYNSKLASGVKEALPGVRVEIIHRTTYRALPKQINEHHPDLVVSLHCNAFNKKATGTETLYYHSSTEGKRMASLLQRKIVDVLGLADRGIKPKHSEDRGGYLLRETNAPCVLAEPFFIDNNKDLKIAQANHSDLVRAYADAINEMLV